MMSADYSPRPICGLEEADAVMEDAVLSLIDCRRCGSVLSFDPESEDLPEFDQEDYEWTAATAQCPEETGLYLVQLAEGHTVALYHADESGTVLRLRFYINDASY